MTQLINMGTGVNYQTQKSNMGMEISDLLVKTLSGLSQFKQISDSVDDKKDREFEEQDNMLIDKFKTVSHRAMITDDKFSGKQEKEVVSMLGKDSELFDITDGSISVVYRDKLIKEESFKEDDLILNNETGRYVLNTKHDKSPIKLMASMESLVQTVGLRNLSPEELEIKKQKELKDKDVEFVSNIKNEINLIEAKIGQPKEDGSLFTESDVLKEKKKFLTEANEKHKFNDNLTASEFTNFIANTNTALFKVSMNELKTDLANQVDEKVTLLNSNIGSSSMLSFSEFATPILNSSNNYPSAIKPSQSDLEELYAKQVRENLMANRNSFIDALKVDSEYKNTIIKSIDGIQNQTIRKEITGYFDSLENDINRTLTKYREKSDKLGENTHKNGGDVSDTKIAKAITEGTNLPKVEALVNGIFKNAERQPDLAFQQLNEYIDVYKKGYTSTDAYVNKLLNAEDLLSSVDSKTYNLTTLEGFKAIVAKVKQSEIVGGDSASNLKSIRYNFAKEFGEDASFAMTDRYNEFYKLTGDSKKAIEKTKELLGKSMYKYNDKFIDFSGVKYVGNNKKSQEMLISGLEQVYGKKMDNITRIGNTFVISSKDGKNSKTISIESLEKAYADIYNNTTGYQVTSRDDKSKFGGYENTAKNRFTNILPSFGSDENKIVSNKDFPDYTLERLYNGIKDINFKDGKTMKVGISKLPDYVKKDFKDNAVYVTLRGNKLFIEGETRTSNGNKVSIGFNAPKKAKK